jgi:predicted aminopeptidase
VIHEIAHNTLWVPGDASFNESYAELVGYSGAADFFAVRGDTRTAARCAALWRDEKRMAAFYGALAGELEALYASGLPTPVLEARREEVFARARMPANNARLIAHRIYTTGFDPMEQMVALAGGDLREGIRRIARSVRRHPSLPALDAVALAVRTPLQGAPAKILKKSA